MTQLETCLKALEDLKNFCKCGPLKKPHNDFWNQGYRAAMTQIYKKLEALSAQGEQGMDHPPKNLEEFKVRLFNDPVAYAYYNMGRAVEQDYRTDPDERASRNFEALYAVINEGFGKRILPDYWLTAEEPFPTPTAQEPPTETQERC